MATTFAGRVARWGPTELVRLIALNESAAATSSTDDCGTATTVEMWARTAFGVLTVQTVTATLRPSVITVYAVELVAALAVSTASALDPGADVSDLWHAGAGPRTGWTVAGHLDPDLVRRQVSAGTEVAQAESDAEQQLNPRSSTKATVSPRLLDTVMLTVRGVDGDVPIPLRMLFALSGMGLLDDDTAEQIRVSVTPSWLRLDVGEAAIMRRRLVGLPLIDLH